MLLPLLMTTIAGLSTGLGGLIAALFRPTPRLMAFCGGFAGAVMLTVSLADLAPALLDFYGALLSPFGCGAAAAALLLGGMLAAWLLACALPDEDTLADRFGSRTQGSAMRAALVTGAALLLHNLPEGILTLLTNVSDPQLGARTALAIALHNIPEGLAVAVPFACATGSRAKGAVAALVSGLAEPAGAVLAALVLAPLLTPGLLNGIVAVVAGIMLWVAAAQLLPAAFEPVWRKMGGDRLLRGGADDDSWHCSVGLIVVYYNLYLSGVQIVPGNHAGEGKYPCHTAAAAPRAHWQPRCCFPAVLP